MLLGLIIKNLAIAKKVELSFEKNLVIISGETGAGKTIIMNAIGIACGSNSNADVIRSGEESAIVEASFSLNDSRKALELLESKSLYDGEDVVVISRSISHTRGKSLINGHLVSIRELSDIGKLLIDMHGQHEIQSLLDSANHLKFVDKYGGKEIIALRDKVMVEISRYNEVRKLIEDYTTQDEKYKEEIDFINFEIQEIENSKLSEEEEQELESEEKILANIKELSEISSSAEKILSDDEISILKMISSLKMLLAKGSQLTEKLLPFKEQIDNLEIEFKELYRNISNFSQSLVFDPNRLQYVQERLSILSKLKLKYKKNIPEIIEYLEDLKKQVASFNSLRDKIDLLEEEKKSLENSIKEHAIELSKKRKDASLNFAKSVEEQLKDLALENAKFMVKFEYIPDDNGIEIGNTKYKLQRDGIDTCEFVICTNPGEDFKPLSQIASGGELSRVMLAIKYVLAQLDEIPILAFDEVDAGIGGKTGEKVAEKLIEISKYRQVICITHLPQIASLPGEHYVVEKEIRDGETYLGVKKLNEYERINEIARMISGSNITETTIKQAEELLRRWK